MKEHTQLHPPPSIDYQSLVFLAVGGSGIVYAIDDKRVLKEYHDGGIAVERRALERLGLHINIVNYFGAAENGLILERGRSVRTIIRECGAEHVLLNAKMRWLQEAAEGMQYMHNKGIIHADVGCHNWIIVESTLKIIDFEGCSIDGEEAGACYEWFSYKESTPAISERTDIFAFGCAVYEVITGRQPYDELSASDDRILRVKQLYAENRFPEVGNMPLSNLMQSCWQNEFSSMAEVLQELKAASLAIKKETIPGPQGVSLRTF